MPDRRLKALWDVKVPVIRELAGVHEYDGVDLGNNELGVLVLSHWPALLTIEATRFGHYQW
jgi:hypothetical protein